MPADTARPWLASYPPGVPADVAWQLTPSLVHMFARSCERFADRTAFTSMGVSMSYRELDAQTRHFAAWLQGMGMKPGDRVAIMLPNCLQYPVALFGALRAGMVAVNVNPLYTPAELAHQLSDSGAVAIVVLENFAHTVEQAMPGTPLRHVVVTAIGDLFPPQRRWPTNFVVRHVRHAVPSYHLPRAWNWQHMARHGALQPLEHVMLGPDDVALIQYTGGTTGRPKGATLTHGNLMANVEQVAAWSAGVLKEGEETVITALPLYHVFALTTNLLVFLRLGGTNVLIPDPRDLKRFIGVLRRTRFTAITGVNTLFAALLNAPAFEGVAAARRGQVKLAVAGGMALQPTVSHHWQALFGRPIIEGYGLSETSPIVCANRLDEIECSGMLGLPVPSTEVAIVDDDGVPQPIGISGEIAVRGPQVMRGYWNNPAATSGVFTRDGWLLTGDIGRIRPDGHVQFLDRKKDIIVVSGMKAFPQEIEDAARLLPGVADAAAVGLPDPHSGEVVMLFVVLNDASLTVDKIEQHLAQRLAGYKRPRRIEIRADLPRTPIGKVLKRQLKAELAASAEHEPVQMEAVA